MNINVEALRHFVCAAEYGSISRVAHEFQLSQATVNKHIRNLELALDCTLFLRSNNHLALTESGRILLNYANGLFVTLKAANAAIHDSNGSLDYDLGISFRTLPILASSLAADFHKQHGDIRLLIQQYVRPMSAYNDIVIFPSKTPIDNSYSKCLAKERILLAVSSNHPFAHRQSVRLAELLSERYIQRPASSEVEQLITPVFQSLMFNPNPAIVIEHTPIINDLVASNFGVAFLPEFNRPRNMADRIALVDIQDLSFFHYINITWPPDGYLSKAAQLFISFCETFFHNLSTMNQ